MAKRLVRSGSICSGMIVEHSQIIETDDVGVGIAVYFSNDPAGSGQLSKALNVTTQPTAYLNSCQIDRTRAGVVLSSAVR